MSREAIGSGAYGCIIRPAFEYPDTKDTPSDDTSSYKKVSKLLRNEQAKDEIDKINEICPILKKITNSKNYFIPNDSVTGIKFDKIEHQSFTNTEKCKNIKDIKDITDNPENFTIIQQLDGGKDLNSYILANINNEDNIKILNTKICNLIKHGVVEMNKKNVLHLDIKPENILIDENNEVRIIDWGFAFQIPDTINDEVLRTNLYTGIMFNVLPSNILFDHCLFEGNTHHSDKQKDFLLKLLEVINPTELSTEQVYKDYLIQILLKFTKDHHFDPTEYFNKVYRHNVDIYSVLLTYCYILYYNDSLNPSFKNGLKQLCYDYMFSPQIAIKKINVEKLITNLERVFEYKIFLTTPQLNSRVITESDHLLLDPKMIHLTPSPKKLSGSCINIFKSLLLNRKTGKGRRKTKNKRRKTKNKRRRTKNKRRRTKNKRRKN